jgi:hypothetical protein
MAGITRKRTRYPEHRARAQELLNQTDPPPPASAIARQVQREFKSQGPTERQVRNWIRDGEIVVEPESAPWTIAAVERPEDIPLVLEALSLFRHPTDKWWPTVARGRWIARLMRANLDPMVAFTFAGYAAREDALTFTRRLADLWDEPRQLEETKAAIRAGLAKGEGEGNG